MSLKICKDCGNEISKGAKSCPKCGKVQGNFFTKHKFLTFILIIVILSVMIASTSNKNNINTTSNKDNTNIISTENTKTSYSIGESFSNKYIKVTYLSVDDNFTNYNKYAEIKDGCKIIKAEFEFENIGTKDHVVSSYDFKCYADSYDCDSFWNVDNSNFSANLSSGKKAKGNVYFQVPINAEKITIEFSTNIWTSENIVFVVK